jgi:hypothetical protein
LRAACGFFQNLEVKRRSLETPTLFARPGAIG